MTILKHETTTPRERALTYTYCDRDYHLPFGERERPYPPLVPIVSGSYRAARNDKIARRASPAITAKVETKRGGWHRGLALLDGVPVYTGRWVRDRDTALDYARMSMGHIREGLD